MKIISLKKHTAYARGSINGLKNKREEEIIMCGGDGGGIEY